MVVNFSQTEKKKINFEIKMRLENFFWSDNCFIVMGPGQQKENQTTRFSMLLSHLQR